MLVSVAASCNNGRGSNPSADGSQHVAVERFDRFLRDYPVMDSIQRDSLTTVFAPAIKFMEKMTGETDTDSMLMRLAASRVVDVFQPDVESRLRDLKNSEIAIGTIRDVFAEKLPCVKFPERVFGIVSPYEQSIMIADSVVFIGLNHYLGSDYEGYGGFDDYRRRLKTQSRLPYDFAEAIIRTQYPFEPKGASTALSRMAYEGAVALVVCRSVPGATLADALAYGDDDIAWLTDNEANIWRKLIEAKLLFSVDLTVAERLVAPSPHTFIINAEAPGRVGRYVGYKVADSYMQSHPEVSFEYLLSPDFYSSASILVDAGYKP